MTALHWAAMNGDAELAERARSTRAPTSRPRRAWAAIRRSTWPRDRVTTAGVRALLEAGSRRGRARPARARRRSTWRRRPGARDDRGAPRRTAPTWTRAKGRHEQTPLMFAAAHNRLDAVKTLLARGATLLETTGGRLRRASPSEDIPTAGRSAEVLQSEERRPGAVVRDGRRGRGAGSPAQTVRRPPAGTRQEPRRARPDGGDAEAKAASERSRAARRPIAEDGAGKRRRRRPPNGRRTRPGKAPRRRAEPLGYADLVGTAGRPDARCTTRRATATWRRRRLLLDAGADVNQLSAGDHTSPLLMATINGHYDLAMYAPRARGPIPNLASDAGATPLFATLNNRWAPKAALPAADRVQAAADDLPGPHEGAARRGRRPRTSG